MSGAPIDVRVTVTHSNPVCAYAGLVRVSSDPSGGFYATADRFGCGKTRPTIQEAIAYLFPGSLGEPAFLTIHETIEYLQRACDHCGKPAKPQARNPELCAHCGSILPEA